MGENIGETANNVRIILGWEIDIPWYVLPQYRIGNTIHIWRRRGHGFSNLTSNVSSIETLARASLKTCIVGSRGIETKRVGQRTAVHGTHAPKVPTFRGGGSDI